MNQKIEACQPLIRVPPEAILVMCRSSRNGYINELRLDFMQFYVSGGHFDSLEGCIWIFSFHEEAGFTLLAERSILRQPENLLSGKGITGLCISAGRCFASFYDRVVELDILTLARWISDVSCDWSIPDSDFNDLHGLGIKTANW